MLQSAVLMCFKIGVGVIAGWSDAVPTLKKNEKAQFMIAPNKAYGQQGSPPQIPPNTELIFTITLISWESKDAPKDINEDGSVLKKVVVESTVIAPPDQTSPKWGKSDVEVHIIGRTFCGNTDAKDAIFVDSRADGEKCN